MQTKTVEFAVTHKDGRISKIERRSFYSRKSDSAAVPSNGTRTSQSRNRDDSDSGANGFCRVRFSTRPFQQAVE